MQIRHILGFTTAVAIFFGTLARPINNITTRGAKEFGRDAWDGYKLGTTPLWWLAGADVRCQPIANLDSFGQNVGFLGGAATDLAAFLLWGVGSFWVVSTIGGWRRREDELEWHEKGSGI